VKSRFRPNGAKDSDTRGRDARPSWTETRYVNLVRFLAEEGLSEDSECRVGSSRPLSINRDGRNGGVQDSFISLRSALLASEVLNRVKTVTIRRRETEGEGEEMPGSVRRLGCELVVYGGEG
jgi:hypothetical protein